MGKINIYIHCDDNETLNSWTKKRYLLEADKYLSLGIFKDFNEAREMPDYVLNIQPCDHTLWYGRKWTGLWHIDVQLESNQFPRLYSTVDTVFLASTAAIAKYDGPIHLLYQACDPTVHKRASTNPEFDFVTCGTFHKDLDVYKERLRTLRILQETFNYHDFGKGFTPQEYVKKISQAKVQWVQSGISKDGLGMCAQRFFECLAIGPVLCNKCTDLNMLGLIEGIDYLGYSNDQEMIDGMNILLKNEGLRNFIADNGRRKALMYHQYEQRAMAIYNIAKEFTHD
jgi:spore maturation protein CgeB